MEISTSLTPQQLRRAANIKERIDTLQGELNELLGMPTPALARAVTPRGPRKRKKISAAGIARIRAAQKARWAAIRRRAKGPAKASAKPKRKISAAGRARLAALARARWAKVKASGRTSL